jgi:hypothetical protein
MYAFQRCRRCVRSALKKFCGAYYRGCDKMLAEYEKKSRGAS